MASRIPGIGVQFRYTFEKPSRRGVFAKVLRFNRSANPEPKNTVQFDYTMRITLIIGNYNTLKDNDFLRWHGGCI